ncbi:MAG: tetratricopeptide repeat protein [Nitrospira sp.]|jgi:tetratricopeptide (TPR) repeat protein|nr:tetratricopeptide repeat protein [Nitrospira sp.]
MTYRIKVPPRTLPMDEAHLAGNMERLLETVRLYRGPLLVGAAILLLAGGIVGGVLWYDAQTAHKAQDLEHEATLHYFTRPSDDPKKADLNLKEAVALYRKIVEEYPRTQTAPVALFQLGNALVQANEVDAAIDAYKRFILMYGSNTSLLGLVQQRLGYAYLLKGDRDQAAKAYSSVLEIPGSLNRDQALFELARLEESLSRPEGALAHYQDLMKNYPNSPLANEAAVRVKVLEVKKSPDPAAAATPAQAPSAASPAATKKP